MGSTAQYSTNVGYYFADTASIPTPGLLLCSQSVKATEPSAETQLPAYHYHTHTLTLSHCLAQPLSSPP